MSHPVWVRGLKQALRFTLPYLTTSHPVWVRGLKLEISDELSPANPVAPRVGAWIETTFECCNHGQVESHPVWVRGLKLRTRSRTRAMYWSHPVWVRGLKLEISDELSPANPVAPRVGAWIETRSAWCRE